jgi:hypothetical protein
MKTRSKIPAQLDTPRNKEMLVDGVKLEREVVVRESNHAMHVVKSAQI